jgi:hypothetical protein
MPGKTRTSKQDSVPPSTASSKLASTDDGAAKSCDVTPTLAAESNGVESDSNKADTDEMLQTNSHAADDVPNGTAEGAQANVPSSCYPSCAIGNCEKASSCDGSVGNIDENVTAPQSVAAGVCRSVLHNLSIDYSINDEPRLKLH